MIILVILVLFFKYLRGIGPMKISNTRLQSFMQKYVFVFYHTPGLSLSF